MALTSSWASITWGALPQLFAATAEAAAGGDFIGPNFMHMRGYPKRVRANAAAYDEEIARRLWEVSAELTQVRYTPLETLRSATG